MPEDVVLQVKLNGAESAIAKLTELQKIVTKLKQQKVTIDVKGNSLQTAANQARRLNTNLTNASKSAANLGNAANQAAGQMQNMGKQGSEAAEDVADSTEKASRNMESFRLGMGSVILNMAKFRIASSVINGVANAFKSAFAEMKNVDTELVNIRKVTGFANDEIEKLSKAAYSMASEYGRSASDVLTASTVFARAGYTDQIEQLSELSLLLQNVGDLQADDASKFIIATDKAYKLGGSYKELTAIIDGLDNITNKNATDMQKMTEGMTVAGSVFAESGESIEMFAALLGTATANTQRSGSEVARGLRTILMNLRQIRGETEDGELIDGESIAAAAKALKDYANISTMENGQLRKASDVLGELAGKWSTLSETQRAAIAEAVGGKRQANILMSIMGDWESVEKMMQEYETAAGTAAKENAMYMDSWQAKTAQVKASWNELVNTFLETDAVKDFLSGTIQFLQTTNDLLGDNESIISRIFSQMAEGYRLYAEDFKKLTEPSLPDRALGAYNISKEIGKANKAFTKDQDLDAYIEKLNSILAKYKDLYDYILKIQQEGGELSEPEQKFISAYETLAKGGKNDIELYGMAAAAEYIALGDSAEEAAQKANEAMSDIAESLGYIPNKKTIDIELEGAEKTLTLLGAIKVALNLIGSSSTPNPLFGITGGFASGTSGAPGGPALVNENGPELLAANGIAWIAGGGKPTVTMLPRGAQVYTAAETRSIFGGIPSFAGGTNDAGESLAEEIAGAIKDALFGKTYNDIDLNAKPETNPYGRTTQVGGEADPIYRRGEPRSRKKIYDPETGKNVYESYPGGGPGSTVKSFEQLEKELSDRLKNLNAQAKLAENEQDFLKAMQIYGEAQEYISELLEQYRAAGYAEDSNEILTLANLGYDYAAKQLGGYDKLQQNLIDALNALTKATDDANALAEKREAVEKAREALANAEKQRTVRIFNPVTGQWEWVANAGDIEKARENLANAEKNLQKEELSQAINAIKNADASSLGSMTLSPAILDALFNASPEQQSAFLNALGAATGGANWLSSSAAQTPWNQGTSIGTQYNLNGISLTAEQASGMTIMQLISLLQGFKIM